ncbi:hypothetical protein ACYX7E_09600 [Luteimonas sp. RIT-PG2_3]
MSDAKRRLNEQDLMLACNAQLRRHGLRATSARRLVLCLLLDRPDDDADQSRPGVAAMQRQLAASGRPFQASTIYRVLNDFQSAGLLAHPLPGQPAPGEPPSARQPSRALRQRPSQRSRAALTRKETR